MGRRYIVPFVAVAVVAQQDLFEIVAPADAVVIVHDIHLSQSSEVGDAAEESLSILMKKGATTSGSGGSAPTPAPLELGDAAFGGTTEVNNTTKATSGTIVQHGAYNWNIRVPLDIVFTPETRPVISPSARLTLELATTPADSITASGYMTIEEIGG